MGSGESVFSHDYENDTRYGGDPMLQGFADAANSTVGQALHTIDDIMSPTDGMLTSPAEQAFRSETQQNNSEHNTPQK